MSIAAFVLTKPGVEAGETLEQIARRKERARLSGHGVFWWGIGSSLGPALREAAIKRGGSLPVVFIQLLTPGKPKAHDAAPARILKWTKWQDWQGTIKDIPAFADVTSRGDDIKRTHYALVCRSADPIVFNMNGTRFDLSLCKTASGKRPGSSQVTALLWGDLEDPAHAQGQYRILYRAMLIDPWQAKLVSNQ